MHYNYASLNDHLVFQVSQKVQEDLTERAASFGITLDDISLVIYVISIVCPSYKLHRQVHIKITISFFLQTHLTFGREFTEAVELKQVGKLFSFAHVKSFSEAEY